MELGRAVAFRVTRDSEYEIDDEVEDLLKAIEEEVQGAAAATPVRLEIEADAPAEVEQFLTDGARPRTRPTSTRSPGLLDLTGLFQVYGLPGLRRPARPAVRPARRSRSSRRPPARGRPSAAATSSSTTPTSRSRHVVDFIEAAADDDRVLAIKQTLYRTSQRLARSSGPCSGPPTTASR